MNKVIGLLEKAISEVSDIVGNRKIIGELTKSKTFPKVGFDPDEQEKEALHYASDELIRCLRHLNQARKNLSNLGIQYEEEIQTEGQTVRLEVGRGIQRVSGTKITS